MERLGSAPASSPEEAKYVSWEEVNTASDSGKAEVRYYLRRSDGGTDLGVVGKERSLRHVSYHYGNRIRSISVSIGPLLKLRTRREVIDWLNSVVQDSSPRQSSVPARSLSSSYACESDALNIKDPQSQKITHVTRAFLWLGSPWMCRRKRKHYPSFHRNGVKISVYEFVFVLAEEGKRLVAYLEDMYEDSKGSKMVVVRWFHKIDEVGIPLPHNYNDREVFFSLCLQELSVECIDGLAVVLSPQHFQKLQSVAVHTRMNSFVCCHLFEDDEVKPFNVTKLKGYWNQEIVRHMYSVSGSKKDEAALQQFDHDDEIRPRKRLCRSADDGLHSIGKPETGDDKHDLCGSLGVRKLLQSCPPYRGGETVASPSKTEPKESPTRYLKIGYEVEVLSQDSGIRGCWFRARIIKKHKDKVKVRYEDIKDAADEANNLEEWMLASRVANPEKLGIRIAGRKIVRPSPELDKDFLFEVNTGAAVDVWWHDGWWEGIIIRMESEHSIHVYFPGENKEAVFGRSNLRQSQEWLGKGWIKVKARPEIVDSIPSRALRPMASQPVASKLAQPRISDSKHHSRKLESDSSSKLGSDQHHSREVVTDSSKLDLDSRSEDESKEEVLDLSKDNFLTQLRWKSSRKRRRGFGGGGTPASDLKNNQKNNISKMSLLNIPGSNARLLISNALNMDHENCKYMRDSMFGSSAVQPLTSLVMSR